MKRSVSASDVPGQQRFDVVEGSGGRELREDSLEVGVGLEAVGLGGFDERVEVGAGPGAVDGIGEEPVLAPGDEGADGVLAAVVVDVESSVVAVADEAVPVPVEIEPAPSERTPRNGLMN